MGSNVTEYEIDWLYRSRRIPAGVTCRIPDDEIEPDPEPDEYVVFLAHFERGFGLPASPFFREFLDFYKLQPHHLPGNAIFYLSCYATFMEAYIGIRPTRETFARFFALRINSVQGLDIPKPKPPVQCGSCISRQGSPFFKFSGLESCRLWQGTFFYVKNNGAADLIDLPLFDPAPPTKANWGYNPKESHNETNRIIRFMKQRMKDTNICSDDIVRTFVSRRVLPLKRRAHRMSEMYGPGDPTKITGHPLSKKDVVLKAKQICQTAMPFNWEWGLLPFSTTNPPTQEAKDRFPLIEAERRGACRKRALDSFDPDPYVFWKDLKMGKTPAARLGRSPPKPTGSSDDLTMLEIHEHVPPLRAEAGSEFVDKLMAQGQKNKQPASDAGSNQAPPSKRFRTEPLGRSKWACAQADANCFRRTRIPAPATSVPEKKKLPGGRSLRLLPSPKRQQLPRRKVPIRVMRLALPLLHELSSCRRQVLLAPSLPGPLLPRRRPRPPSLSRGRRRPLAPLPSASSLWCCMSPRPPGIPPRRPPVFLAVLLSSNAKAGTWGISCPTPKSGTPRHDSGDPRSGKTGCGHPVRDRSSESTSCGSAAVKELDIAWYDATNNLMLTADARKALFEELLWEHRELAEAHDKCQVIPEASIDALKEQLAAAQREKDQLIRQHQEELSAYKTSHQELKSQLIQLGLDHAKALKAAEADAAAKMDEALEDAGNATVVLRAELEELAKARKGAEEKAARLEEEHKECNHLILQTDALAYPTQLFRTLWPARRCRILSPSHRLKAPAGGSVSGSALLPAGADSALRVACSWYPELDLDALTGVREGAETDLDPILTAKRQDRAYHIAEYAEMRTFIPPPPDVKDYLDEEEDEAEEEPLDDAGTGDAPPEAPAA
ncbi:hypothetical protein QYE76_024382 [Lolium multiflorum]|uniref:Transposase (putative) gypsy type domain-containing protein n=1 Tax=Lolium multiflorum TaxID=4521 RepID=A0AAD8RDL2_LOLMU|nr:hypothetical protein QYE76_024382 [Lolium multiflorum]